MNKNKDVTDVSVNGSNVATNHDHKTQSVASNDILLKTETKQINMEESNQKETSRKRRKRKKDHITIAHETISEETKSRNINNSVSLTHTEHSKKTKLKTRKRGKCVNQSETSEELGNTEQSSKEKVLKSETDTDVISERNCKEKNKTDFIQTASSKPHKKKKKRKSFEISDDRLKAYGINPKKFKYTKSRFLTV